EGGDAAFTVPERALALRAHARLLVLPRDPLVATACALEPVDLDPDPRHGSPPSLSWLLNYYPRERRRRGCRSSGPGSGFHLLGGVEAATLGLLGGLVAPGRGSTDLVDLALADRVHAASTELVAQPVRDDEGQRREREHQ